MSDPSSDWFASLPGAFHCVGELTLFARSGGRADAPPPLLLHGFPADARDVAPRRPAPAPHFHLVLPDLRGYGDSDKPRGEPAHANYSKRSMAADMAALMRSLGHERYAVCGHDRGARVAHRLALDHAGAVTKLARCSTSRRRWTCTTAPTCASPAPTTTGST